MKKILLLGSFTLLLTPAISKTMDNAGGLQQEIPNAPMQHGDPNAPRYALVNPEALQNNPVFKRLQAKDPNFQQNIEFIVQDLVLLPKAQQDAAIAEIAKDDLEMSTLISSVIVNTDIPEVQPTIAASEQTVDQAPTADATQSSTTSGLSWTLAYKKLLYGEQGALQYALDNDQFNPNNTDHIALYDNVKNGVLTQHKSLDSAYTEHFNNLKAAQCVAIVALSNKLEAAASEYKTQYDNLITEQNNAKEALLKEHHEKYQQNAQHVELLQKAHSEINPDQLLSIELLNSPESQTALKGLRRVAKQLSAMPTFIANQQKEINVLSQQFAIENNK